MKYTFIVLGLLISSAVYSQVETNSVPMNNNSLEPSSVQESEEELDTIAIDLKDVETIQKSKAEKKVSRSYQNKTTSEVSKAAALNMQSNTFKYSKIQASSQYTQRTPTSGQQQLMDDAVDYFEANAPNSFEYHYFRYTAGGYDVSLKEHLLKAEQLKPNNSDVQIQMSALYTIEGNDTKAIEYLDKLKASSRLSNSVINYGVDLLTSVPKNGTLITHGFDDFNAAYYQQKKNKIRTDVQIISLDYLQSDEYRKKLKNKGYTIPVSKVVDVNYFKEFVSKNASKSIAVSMTVPKQYLSLVVDKLYVTGLVFEYHNDAYSNFERNKELWNSDLKKHLIIDAIDQKGKTLTANYLPMLLQLNKVYTEAGENTKADEISKVMDQIGALCNKYEQVQQLKSSY